MSKLYLTESGHVVHTLCEELTTYRRARKVLLLPLTKAAATLYVLARPYPHSDLPLRLSVNGAEIEAIQPESSRGYRWYEVPIDACLLEAGPNPIEFWCDATAMNGWSLAIEAGHANPQSFISDDGGRTWRNEKMAYLNVLRGEYVVRIRLAEGEDPAPPAMVWEDPANPRLASLRNIMPAEALQAGALFDRVRVLTRWLSSSWEHTAYAAQYAPWDAETILAWGKARSGHAGQLPVVMCVHYAVAFVSCCQAAGIPARCAILKGTPHGEDGHFVAEVWSEEHGKWVMVDPNLDAILWKNGVPLSMTEVQEAGSDLSDLIEWGPGIEYQRKNPRIGEWLDEVYLQGICFRHRSIWPRSDLLSRPELSPPDHGSIAYCETNIVWERRDLQRGMGMFRYFGDSLYFDAPPCYETGRCE